MAVRIDVKMVPAKVPNKAPKRMFINTEPGTENVCFQMNRAERIANTCRYAVVEELLYNSSMCA